MLEIVRKIKLHNCDSCLPRGGNNITFVSTLIFTTLSVRIKNINVSFMENM